MQKINCVGVCKGTGSGKLYILKDEQISDLKNEIDSRLETAKFSNAKSRAKRIYDDYTKKAASDNLKEAADVFMAQKEILSDEEFDKFVVDLIENENISAADSIRRARDYFCDILNQSDEEKMMARSHDVYEISDMLINELSDEKDSNDALFDSDERVIIASKHLSVSLIIRLGRERIAGMITECDGKNSHAAILAESLDIPVVTGCLADDLYPFEGKETIIDATDNLIYVEPDAITLEKYSEKLSHKDTLKNIGDTKMPLSFDENKIKIYANIANANDAKEAMKKGAAGIGLFRTEFIFMDSYESPSLEKQFEIYKEVAEITDGKEVIIRTADIGGDKKVPYMTMLSEGNPALGLRGIRRSLSEPELFKTQLKAILMASAYGNISIMFPLVVCRDEVVQAKKYLREVEDELKKENIPFDENIKVGIMIETPAAALMADDLAKISDFFSVGSNDLTQYTLAIDRCNSSVEKYYDSHHPAVIKLLESVAESAHKNGIKAGICGELASDITMKESFIRMGYESLSVPVSKIDALHGFLTDI